MSVDVGAASVVNEVAALVLLTVLPFTALACTRVCERGDQQSLCSQGRRMDW